MTYDQYQQLYSSAKAQIAARVAKIQPTAGNGASVLGMGIAIEAPVAEQPEPQAETWSLHLFAEVNGGGVEWAGTMEGNVFLRTAFWERTQLFDIPAGPVGSGVPRQYEAKRIRFTARAIENSQFRAIPSDPTLSYARRLFEASYYRIPVRLTIIQYNVYETDNPNRDVVAKYNLDLRRNGQERFFQPVGSDVFQLLDYQSIVRI